MKVRIELTVEVDPAAWKLNYGTPDDRIRQDVREWVENAAATAPVPMMPVKKAQAGKAHRRSTDR